MRMRRIFLAGALALLAGCGGGGTGGSGAAPARSRTEARFDVDIRTGKVSITPAAGRAVFQGSAVSFTSSDLLTVSGDSGQRLIHIAAQNNSGQSWGGSPVRLTVSDVVNADAAALRANVRVSAYAGSGTNGGADGYRTSAQLGTPQSVCAGQGPLDGSLLTVTYDSIRRIWPDGTVTTLAGEYATPGTADGTGTAARFTSPDGIASDAAGNLFVADTYGHRVRRITPLGEVTTIAGTGTTGGIDGLGTVATLHFPQGIQASADGNRIYVGCNGSHTVRLLTFTGSSRNLASSYTVSTVAGVSGSSGFVDGVGTAARLWYPYHLALLTDAAGAETLFVVEYGTNAVRRISAPASGAALVSTIAGDGTAGDTDGPGSVARFRAPVGIAGQWVDTSSFVLYVTDSSRVRAITLMPGASPTQKGSYSVVTLAGSTVPGAADGDGNTASFYYPRGLAIQGAGSCASLFVADFSIHRIRQLSIPGGALHSGGSGSAGAEAPRVVNWDVETPNRTAWQKTMTAAGQKWSADLQFFVPSGVTGFSFLATVETNTDVTNLPGVGASTISTLAGNGYPESNDGIGRQAQLFQPAGIVAVPAAMRSLYRSPSGLPVRAFIVDTGNHRIRFLDANGYVGVWAGGAQGSADGNGPQAQFSWPHGLALGPDGSLFVTEVAAQRLRRVWPNQQVTTVAGDGAGGATDGAGSVARFNLPRGVAVTSGGRIYVADSGNHTIRRIVQTGPDPRSPASYTVSTVAGTATVPGAADGVGTVARFRLPNLIAVDNDGRLYVADQGNRAIRVLSPTAPDAMTSVTLVASFLQPVGVALDSAHNVYVTDAGTSLVCRVSPAGTVVVLAGVTSGFVDGASGSMNYPTGIDVEESGTVLVSDTNNNALRAISRLITAPAP